MNSNPISILLIEDDPADLMMIRQSLESPSAEKTPYTVTHVDSLAAGLHQLKERSFQLLLLDLTLTGNRGIETLTRVRRHCLDVPIIVLTHLDDDALAREALSNGAQDYLVKNSFNAHHLRRAIAYALERHNLLQKLERSTEERFRYLIEKSTDGMVIVDRDGIVRFANPAVEQIFEHAAADIVGQRFDFHRLSRSQSRGEIYEMNDLSLKYVSLLARTGKTTELEITFDDDLVKLVEMRATDIQWEMRPAFTVVFHDITNLMRLQRLKAEVFERERVSKLKDEFISTVSHELRTPLAIIKCAIENMKDGVTGALSEKQEKIVRIASTNVDRLTKLIDDILDLSRLEAGTVKVARRPVSLAQLAQETIRRFTLLAKEHNISIEADVPFNLPVVYADIDKITQVLDNLISNALRFAKDRIVLEARAIGDLSRTEGLSPREAAFVRDFSEAARDGVRVSVIDDGQGIPSDKVDQLFGKFVQIDRPTGGAGYKGTGLGLAICKEIVELHEGKIWAESEFGAGAKFHFILPRHEETSDAREKST